ncbi:hypothetical protein HUW46_09229 [Amycolatopsis sp. CA-230715]|nr:hypothetical protein HUW46_09229 [Amycolatopsis sp. CA-230715]
MVEHYDDRPVSCPAWKNIAHAYLCSHYEDNTQPGDCVECVCADCGEWVGSTEIFKCGGLCEKCLAGSRTNKANET